MSFTSGSRGAVWHYTAIDVASSYCWAELHLTPRKPSSRWTSEPARRVAEDLAAPGWSLETVIATTRASSEAPSSTRLARLGARHVFIRAERPQTNGVVERVRRTILDEYWKPAFARYLIPKYTGLRLDLERYGFGS